MPNLNNNQNQSILSHLDDYQDIFGSLNYLECEPCQSIFGPAAYFVNLMGLVEENITKLNNSIPEGLKLNERRPDLQNIALDCDHTNNPIFYTQIVNKVLEEKLKEVFLQSDLKKFAGEEIEKLSAQIQAQLLIRVRGAMTPKEALTEVVLKDVLKRIDLFKLLATAKYPQNLPFNFSLEQIRLYLGHLNTSLADIYQTLHPQDPYSSVWAREYLGLSLEEYDLITNTKDLQQRYGFDSSSTNYLQELKKKETFLKRTGLSWQELNDLLYQNLSKDEIDNSVAAKFYINKSLAKNPLKLDNITIENLDDNSLYRIDSFLRLSRKLGWSFADLDWVLTSIQATDIKEEAQATDIKEEAIKNIAKIKLLQAKTKLPLDVLCSFWHDMKTIGKGDNPNCPQNLFDRIFNDLLIINNQNSFYYNPNQDTKNPNQDNKNLIKWDIDEVASENSQFGTSRLLEALQLSDEELMDIVNEFLKKEIKIEIKIENESEKQTKYIIELNVANLSKLFRINQILKLLKLKVGEFKLLLQFLPQPISTDSFEKLEINQLIEIIELTEWLKVSGFTLYELDYILNGNIHPSVKVLLPEEKMSAFMESLWQKVHLSDQEELNINSVSQINEQLAIHFGIEVGLFSVLLQMAEIGETDYLKLLLTKVNPEKNNISWQKIVSFLAFISRMYLLLTKIGITETIVRYLIKYPDAFNSNTVKALGYILKFDVILKKLKSVDQGKLSQSEIQQDMTSFSVTRAQFFALFPKEADSQENRSLSFDTESVNVLINLIKTVKTSIHPCLKDIKDIHSFAKQVLSIFNHSEIELVKYFENPSIKALSAFTGWEEEQINKTLLNKYLNDNELYKKFEGLLKLKQCFDLCTTIGCDIDVLCDLCDLLHNEPAETHWNDYQKAANSAIAFVKAKYNHEEWEKVASKLNGMLEERKCQILTNFGLLKLEKENPRQLSEYLLLDVEMTSCACNSEIQLAILSVQTYLQRCRMGIEPGVTTVDIPDVRWEWIMNYRKWEANRKVFLYPENYIDPSLRKNASPIFKELQDELLQSEITAETVEAAYRNYFDKFAELARLQIVDSCRYSVQTPKSPAPIDTLFIFAKTITQPHTFYYRRCENPKVDKPSDKPSWGYWEKIDLQINSDYLAPVYAFNRLFVFWVETKETEKPKKNVDTIEPNKQEKMVQATIKYSFLTASKKWVSPQTFFTDTEKSSEEFKAEQGKSELCKQVYPLVVRPKEPQNPNSKEEILVFWGGFPALKTNEFEQLKNKYEENGFQFVKKRLTEDLLISSPSQTGNKPSFNTLPAELSNLSETAITPIKSESQGFILQQQNQAFFTIDGKASALTRLTTSTIQEFSRTLFTKGLDGLLSLESQLICEMDLPGISSNNKLDFDGAYGVYFWEIFFHIPFLIASTLNAHQRYNEARQWYQYIFNPASIAKPQPQPPKPQLPEPIAYWLLNEGTNTTIYDKKGNNGTLKGNPVWKKTLDFPGDACRWVLQFDGTSNYVGLRTASELKLKNSDFTVEAWVKVDDLNSNSAQTILGMDENTAKDEQCFRLGIRDKRAYIIICWGEVKGYHELKKGTWYQIVWRYTHSTSEQAIFINGNLDVSQERPPLQGDGQVNIGCWDKQDYFQGQIANVRIWDKALSNKQIFDNAYNLPDRFWQFLPFRGYTLEKVEAILNNPQTIKAYKDNPFDPHAIARLRIGAYEKAVVMKYIDNILNWADALFTQDSWESISQATTLYLLAYDLLGSKPKNLGKPPASKPKTFAQLKGKIADFLLVDLDQQKKNEYENFIKQFGNSIPFNAIDAYFCVNENQQFAQYWDRVEDRLFKIRHCQNIKGIERQLALFQPPIDPMQLVRQSAAGDGAIALSIADNIPHYRFFHLLERAKGMAATVIQLGSTLLNTLEKKDAEELALLRTTQESALLQLITKTKEKQIEEAQASFTSLQRSLEAARHRSQYYQNLIDGRPNSGELTTGEAVMNVAGAITGEAVMNVAGAITGTGGLPSIALSAMDDLGSINALGLNARESSSIKLMREALYPQIAANVVRGTAALTYPLPNIFGVANGGMQFGDAVNMGAAILDGVAGVLNQGASLASTVGQFQRRKEDWELQQKMAEWDVKQIEEQLKAAQVRVEMSKAELDIHHKSIEQSREIEEFFKDKFTNKELYQWMVNRLSSIYFQTYKIALEMAYSAQKAYQYELNKDDTYLQPTYWDSNKKGLLAGESLMLGLNQLEKAYLDGSARRLEIEKIISLRRLLGKDVHNNDIFDVKKNEKAGVKWIFSLTQQHFDDDFSGHYCRQIKTISVTIPAVVGPYQTIKAILTQTSNKVLIKSDQNAVKWLLTRQGNSPDSGTLRQDLRNNGQIAISKGVNDSGLFVLNFQDERYLPFEGTGAISDWTLSMPKATNNQIDFNSITDVIITLSYTALQG